MSLEAGTIFVPVRPDTSGFASGVQTGLGSKMKGIGQSLGGALGIGLSIGAAVEFGKKSIEAFDALQESTKRLSTGLQAIGRGSDLDGILGWAKSFSLQTGTNESAIVEMTSQLGTMGHAFFEAAGPDAASAMEKLTEGMTNLGAATGKSAGNLMRSLGPAIVNAPAKATTSLKKFGVLTDAQVERIKALVDAGHDQAASQLEINLLQARYAGVAAKTATVTEKIANFFNQVQLFVGKWVEKTFILIGVLSKHKEVILAVGIAIAAVVLPAFIGWAIAAATAAAATLAAAAPVILVTVAIAALAYGVIQLVKHWRGAWHAIKTIVAAVFNWVKGHWPLLLTILTGPIGLAVVFIVRHWNTVKAVFKAVFGSLAGIAGRAWDGIKAVFGGVARFFSGIWGGVKQAFKDMWNWLAGAWNGSIGAISFHVPGTSITFDVPNLPTLARGGLITQPTVALLGEAGPEMVVPGGGRGQFHVIVDNPNDFGNENENIRYDRRVARSNR